MTEMTEGNDSLQTTLTDISEHVSLGFLLLRLDTLKVYLPVGQIETESSSSIVTSVSWLPCCRFQ